MDFIPGGGDPAISGDGRFVAFQSGAGDLVSGDTNDRLDIFVYDRQTGQTERVSISSDGEQGNSDSRDAVISSDGRFVAFESFASNLVSEGANEKSQVFVHDRQTGQTELVSISSEGELGNGDSVDADISADGRFVAFYSWASNLVIGDTNGKSDVFVHDRQTGKTERVSISSDGKQAEVGDGTTYNDYGSGEPAISADGRFIAFTSYAPNLVSGDTNNDSDIYIHDRQTGKTEQVSISLYGGGAKGAWHSPAISADGRFVAFMFRASLYVSGDSNLAWDIYVHDRQTGKTERVSISSDGDEANGESWMPAISADGRFVTFVSNASNLVSGDKNGWFDVYVHDRQTGRTERVSSFTDEKPWRRNDSEKPSISADGRFIVYSNNYGVFVYTR